MERIVQYLPKQYSSDRIWEKIGNVGSNVEKKHYYLKTENWKLGSKTFEWKKHWYQQILDTKSGILPFSTTMWHGTTVPNIKFGTSIE